MKHIIQKIKNNYWVLRYLPQTIYFNFHYLPFSQAIHIPILLYKPKFVKLKGSIIIESEKIHTGMIKLGVNNVSIYPNNGISIELDGNIHFKGICNIGNNSALSIKNKVCGVTFGDNFNATTSLKLVCYNSITIGKDVLVGWNCIICDTDFHTIINLKNKKESIQSKPIVIGNHVWIAHNCCIHKGSNIPNNTIIAAKSLVNTDLDIPSFSIVAGCPVKLKQTDIDWK